MATGLVLAFFTVKQGSKQLKAREDYDLRPAESFNDLIGRAIEEIPVDADIRVTMYPDARELAVWINLMVASLAMINPYVVVHITQPEPQPKSAAALEADAKAAAARAGALLRSAPTRMGKLPKKNDAGKLLRAESKALNWVVGFLAENELGFPDREKQTPAGSGLCYSLPEL